MITRFRSQFRSRDAAWAAAKRLSHLVPAHDYEAWPDRGYWVLVMRYCDDDGHLRFKFVGHEDLSLPKSRFERADDVARQGSDAQQRLRTARSGVCRARPGSVTLPN
jgi:hypothetical protein